MSLLKSTGVVAGRATRRGWDVVRFLVALAVVLFFVALVVGVVAVVVVAVWGSAGAILTALGSIAIVVVASMAWQQMRGER